MFAGNSLNTFLTVSILCCFMVLSASVSLAKSFKIYGDISDIKGQALPGVHVSLKNNGSAKTDETGQYMLTFQTSELPLKYVIAFSLKGFKTSYRAFTLKEASSVVIPLNLCLKKIAAPKVPASPVVADFGQAPAVPVRKTKVSPVKAVVAIPAAPPVIRTKKELRYIMGVPTYVDVPLTRAEVAAADARLRAIQEAQNPKPKSEKIAVVSGRPVKFSIKGNVVNNRGRAVGGAEVFLGKNQEAYAKTDRRGKFTLEFTVPSVLVEMGRTLIIQHSNFETRNVPVRFNPQRDAGVSLKNIRLQRYRGILDRR